MHYVSNTSMQYVPEDKSPTGASIKSVRWKVDEERSPRPGSEKTSKAKLSDNSTRNGPFKETQKSGDKSPKAARVTWNPAQAESKPQTGVDKHGEADVEIDDLDNTPKAATSKDF